MKHYLLLPLFAGLLACTSTQNAGTATANKTVTTASIAELAGLYYARLPCPDCGGVRVNLLLEADSRYDKSEEITDSQDIYFETGQWQYKDGNVLLTPDANDKETVSTIRWFRYDGTALILLNEDGKNYSGKPARYRFVKK